MWYLNLQTSIKLFSFKLLQYLNLKSKQKHTDTTVRQNVSRHRSLYLNRYQNGKMELLISVQLNEITKTEICLDYEMCSSHHKIISCNIFT